MTSLVDEVARAIKADACEQMGGKPLAGSRPEWGDWTAVGDPSSLDLERFARAALSVIAKWLHQKNEEGDGDVDFILFELDRATHIEGEGR